MKMIKTLATLTAGVLFTGIANAQVAAPRPSLPGPGSLTITDTRNPNRADADANRSRAGRSEDSYVQQLGTGQYASVIQNSYSNTHADIVQTANATNGDAYQEQIQTNSTLPGSSAYIYQNGQRDLASQYQNGASNRAVASQTSTGFSNLSYQEQTGNNNAAIVSQTGLVSGNVGGNFAQQVQQGDNNLARTTQDYSNAWSVIEQRGNTNTALVRQQ